jgi:hypothetical protein
MKCACETEKQQARSILSRFLRKDGGSARILPAALRISQKGLVPIPMLPAAKRRKNAAHGASRGGQCKKDQPHRGERLVATLSLEVHPI